MATVKIGNQTTAFEPGQANTTYLLAEGKTIDSPTSGILQAAAITGMEFTIAGRIDAVETGMALGAFATPEAGLDIHVTKSGRVHGDTRAIQIYGTAQHLTNDGRLTGIEGIRSTGDGAVIVNTGRIDATQAGIITTGTHTVTNSGIIDAGLYGVVLNGSAAGGSILINSGSISGANDAVRGSDHDDRMINRGSIDGDVDLGLGEDRFVYRGGTIKGEVSGGGNNDTYVIHAKGLDIAEASNGGYDRLHSTVSMVAPKNVEEVYLTGKADLNARAGETSAYLEGNRGDNHLKGGMAGDAFAGGAGEDVITGGGGADYFVFRPDMDREIITDFVDGTDFLLFFAGDEVKTLDDLLAHHMHQKGDDLVISADGTELILRGVDKADIDMNDFTT
jgi:Ca2+-binding RTX toxin-like protein